jgi:FAD/FMN-containing dehydrogenase
MIGNNSCGVHSVMAGKTEDNVEELDVLTYDGVRLRVGQTSAAELEHIITAGGRRGEIYARLKALRDKYADVIRQRYPAIPRRVSGYNLPQLLPENGFHVARALVGSEGTCVTVLETTVRLVESPPVRALLVLGYPDVYTAGDHIMEVLAHRPIGLEGLDDVLVDDMRKKGLHPHDRAPAGIGAHRRDRHGGRAWVPARRMDDRGVDTARIHQADGLLGRECCDLPMRQIARQAAAPDVDLGIDDLHRGLSSRCVPSTSGASLHTRPHRHHRRRLGREHLLYAHHTAEER